MCLVGMVTETIEDRGQATMRERIFKDRRHAGRELAAELARRGYPDPVVLALPRGGVPVADEIARRLAAPLDVVLVRKIGAPGQPELAVGAVVDGAAREIVLNEDIVAELGVSAGYIEATAARELDTIERRRRMWMGGKPYPSLTGRTVIVVDDGIATGATMRAALVAVRRREPATLIVAAPVAPPSVARAMRALADEVVCLIEPEVFGAIGYFYGDFAQVEDAEVGVILAHHTHLS